MRDGRKKERRGRSEREGEERKKEKKGVAPVIASGNDDGGAERRWPATEVVVEYGVGMKKKKKGRGKKLFIAFLVIFGGYGCF